MLKHVAAGLKAFYENLVAHNMANEVLILIWSEFSRRVADNASGGTDHGAATNIYLLGGAVIGGTYGPDPNLTDLAIGNLKTKVVFRSVHAEIISKWLGGDPAAVLNGDFPQLGFL